VSATISVTSCLFLENILHAVAELFRYKEQEMYYWYSRHPLGGEKKNRIYKKYFVSQSWS